VSDEARRLAAILADLGESPSDPALRRRTGTVTAVAAGGIYTITLGGTSVPGVRSLVPLVVGDVAEIVLDGLRPLAVGHVDTGWHLIGAAGEPAFQNSWANYGSAWAPARFRKVGGVVKLSGLIAGGTNGAAAFTLTAGFRPAYDEIFAGRNSRFASLGGTGYEGATRNNVRSSGAVEVNAENAYNTYVTLDGISFIAEQ
jgi:hypothetical protein